MSATAEPPRCGCGQHAGWSLVVVYTVADTRLHATRRRGYQVPVRSSLDCEAPALRKLRGMESFSDSYTVSRRLPVISRRHGNEHAPARRWAVMRSGRPYDSPRRAGPGVSRRQWRKRQRERR